MDTFLLQYQKSCEVQYLTALMTLVEDLFFKNVLIKTSS